MDFKVKFSGTGHRYTKEEVDVVANVMQTATPLTQGVYRDQFEAGFAKYLGVDYAFTVNNATSALELAAQLCLFENGDEVVCPSHTFTASLYPFIKKGAKPVWADINLAKGVVSIDTIKDCITDRTKAIIVVHLYGYCIDDIEEIAQYAKENNILLIEDVAQAMGTEIKGQKAGSFGDFGVFSFHSHKNLTTLGEGGMLVVKERKYSDIIPLLRHNGHCSFDYDRKEYWIPAMGNVDLPELDGHYLMPNNFCLGEVECALGLKLLERLDEMNNFKRARAIRFIDRVYSESKTLKFNRVETSQHNYHLLAAEVSGSKRDIFIEKMSNEKGVQCVVQYYPLDRYDLYKKLGFNNSNCLNADLFFDNMVSFPFHHWMSDTDFEYMLNSTISVLKEIS